MKEYFSFPFPKLKNISPGKTNKKRIGANKIRISIPPKEPFFPPIFTCSSFPNNAPTLYHEIKL